MVRTTSFDHKVVGGGVGFTGMIENKPILGLSME